MFSQTVLHNALWSVVQMAGIHLEKDMCVPLGHTIARTVCLFEI